MSVFPDLLFPRVFLPVIACAFAFAHVRAAEPVQFNRDIRPILNAHCLKCHGGVKEAGELNLQFREQALQAGETGEIAVVPGKPEESAFIERLTTDDKSERMPKKEPPLPRRRSSCCGAGSRRARSGRSIGLMSRRRRAGRGSMRS